MQLDGSIAALVKLFKIDHPSDPANKYLYHACIESNEATNICRGNITIDNGGAAVVVMPDWMEDLNENFSYQLTPIGGWAPLYVAEELYNNKFTIAGGKPGMKVMYILTGVRKDAYMKANPMQVEVDKGPDRGKYIRPELFGAGVDKNIHAIEGTQEQNVYSLASEQ